MRTVILTTLIAVMIAGIAMPSFAYKKNSIEFHTLMLALGLIEIRYERTITGHIGVYGEFGYGFKPYIFGTTGSENYDWDTYTFSGGINFYPKGELRGIYIAFDAEYDYFKLTDKTTQTDTTSKVFVPAGLLGYKWIVSDLMVIRLGAGGGYFTGEVRGSGGTEVRGPGVGLALDFTLGFAF